MDSRAGPALPREGSIAQIQALPNGGLVVGGLSINVLTNDLSLTGFSAPSFVRYPFGVLPDGRIIATSSNPAGSASTNSFPCLVRLFQNGSIDSSFNAPQVWNGDNDGFNTIVVQSDGKILVGCFNFRDRTRPSYAGPLFTGIEAMVFRLNVDGSFDGFSSHAGIAAKAIVPLSDGKYLIGGARGDYPNGLIARLLADGTVDPSFTVNSGSSGDYLAINAIMVQPDSKILIVGTFGSISGKDRDGAARLYPDGTLDPFFKPPVNSHGFSAKLQSDGRVVIAFQGLKRLMPDGSADSTFKTGAFRNPTYAVALDPFERVYVGELGLLKYYSGQHRVNIPVAEVPLVLERASVIGFWEAIQSIPANTPFSYHDANSFSPQNSFYRVRPAP